MLNALLSHFRSIICQVVAHERLKTKENFKLLALKEWSRPLTKGSKYSDLTWKLLVFWKTGRLEEGVATGGCTVDVCSENIDPILGPCATQRT